MGLGKRSGFHCSVALQQNQVIADKRKHASLAQGTMDISSIIANMFRIDGDRKIFDTEFINLIRSSGFNHDSNYPEVYSVVKNYQAEDLFDSDGTHLFHLAARHDNPGLMWLLYKSGWDIDVEDSSGTTPLVTAIMSGHFHIVVNFKDDKRDRLLKQLRESEPNASESDQYEKVKIPLMNDFITRLRKKGFSAERIGYALARTHCRLDELVRFQDINMTRAYMQTVEIDHTLPIGLEETFNYVIPKFDLQHIQLLTRAGPRRDNYKMYRFCSSLLSDICIYQKSKEGRDFLKRVFGWEIFNEDNLDGLEDALKEASKKSIRIFLQYNFHLDIKAKYNRDILLGLFSNRNVNVVSFLHIDKIDVDKRGIANNWSKDNSLLHLAARTCAVKNIRSLLDRGADPNTFNERGEPPLNAVACSYECVKLLLLGGANLLLTSRQDQDTFFHLVIDWKKDLEMVKLLTAHLAIHVANGQPVERLIEALKSLNSQELNGFYEECQRQLKMLKSREICDTRSSRHRALTMFTILAVRPEKIACCVTEEDLQEIIKFVKCNRKTVNSYYRQALKKYAKDISEIHRATKVIHEFTGINDPHHLVIEKILNCLSIKDLYYLKQY